MKSWAKNKTIHYSRKKKEILTTLQRHSKSFVNNTND